MCWMTQGSGRSRPTPPPPDLSQAQANAAKGRSSILRRGRIETLLAGRGADDGGVAVKQLLGQ